MVYWGVEQFQISILSVDASRRFVLLSLQLTILTAIDKRQNEHFSMRLRKIRCLKILFAAQLWMTRQPNSRLRTMEKPITFAV